MTDSLAGRCAVLGDPVGHSLSPALHRAGYRALGLDFEYDAVRVPAGSLASFAGGLDPSWRGLSVTAPLKREAYSLAADRSAAAEGAGAVNTLVPRSGGGVSSGWYGDNTDIPGAAAAVRERWPGEITEVTILGGGATATSVGLAAASRGARVVRLLVRTPSRAAETLAVLEAHGLRVDVGALAEDAAMGELVVSTIPAAAPDDGLVSRCADVPAVFEVVYDPWPTPLAAAALASGRALVSGLDLLIHQAVLQFTMFTGHGVPVAVMRSAGETELAARARTSG